MGSKVKEEVVRHLIKMENPSILLLQDTKLSNQTMNVLSQNQWKDNKCVSINSRGASGGIYTVWDSNKFQIMDMLQSQHWIYIGLVIIESNMHFKKFIYMFLLTLERRKSAANP